MTEKKPQERLSEVYSSETTVKLNSLINEFANTPNEFEREMLLRLMQNTLRIAEESHDISELKLMTRTLKEMRYAYRVLMKYKERKLVSLFGSARTPENHPDYLAAKEFATLMGDDGWMTITGAAQGIMMAGHEGVPQSERIGLSIQLPFETESNPFIEGDPKLIQFRYFFTRKLMFLSYADALVAFPGGVGTQDELFECLTLMQTGKTHLVPLVLLEGIGGEYWTMWEQFFDLMIKNGWVSDYDKNLYKRAKTPQEARDHIFQFYKRYHSSRFVKDQLILRLQSPLSDAAIETLNERYAPLISTGPIIQSTPLIEEQGEHPHLTRLIFPFKRRHIGILRAMIDEINNF